MLQSRDRGIRVTVAAGELGEERSAGVVRDSWTRVRRTEIREAPVALHGGLPDTGEHLTWTERVGGFLALIHGSDRS